MILDYGPLVILGYDLAELREGQASNVTYYLKAKDVGGTYSIRTIITETNGPGLVTFDTQVPPMEDGEVISITAPVIIPNNYAGRDFIFTFALKSSTSSEF